MWNQVVSEGDKLPSSWLCRNVSRVDYLWGSARIVLFGDHGRLNSPSLMALFFGSVKAIHRPRAMHTPSPPMLMGFRLGAATALAGVVLDQDQAALPDTTLYTDALKLSLFNLLVLGPWIYSIVSVAPSSSVRVMRRVPSFCRFVRTALQSVSIVGIHAGMYAIVHRAMHKIAVIRPMHTPHHRHQDVVFPSAANAVSPTEFLFAYMLPFYIASRIVVPTKAALLAASSIVSMFNLFVHTPSASDMCEDMLPSWWVKPATHIEHHRSRLPHYAAPTFSLPPATMLVGFATLGCICGSARPRGEPKLGHNNAIHRKNNDLM